MTFINTIINIETGEVTKRPFSDEELENLSVVALEHREAFARAKRNMLLAESDWRVLPDSNSDFNRWSTYRQLLRDLPLNPEWPNIDFPELPDNNGD